MTVETDETLETLETVENICYISNILHCRWFLVVLSNQDFLAGPI